MGFGSKEWNDAAAEDLTVRLVAVLQRPAPQLSWLKERGLLKLTKEEKAVIESKGVTGQMKVVHTTGRGSGSNEVRVVIIQKGPLNPNAKLKLPVPKSGSAIYIQDDGSLKPLSTNDVQSSLTLEVYQEKPHTGFFMDYPKDRTRYGGAIFWWDEKGKLHEL